VDHGIYKRVELKQVLINSLSPPLSMLYLLRVSVPSLHCNLFFIDQGFVCDYSSNIIAVIYLFVAGASVLLIICWQLKNEVCTQLAITSPGSTHGTGDQLQLLIPSPQFDVDDPHAEVLILVLLSLVLLVRLARELLKLLRYLRKLRREFAASGREPIVIPPGHDAQLQAVAVEANTSSRGVSSRIVEATGEY